MKKILIIIFLVFLGILGIKSNFKAENETMYGYDYYNKVIAAAPAYYKASEVFYYTFPLENKEKIDFIDIKFYKENIFVLREKSILKLDKNYKFLNKYYINRPDIDFQSFDIKNDVLYVANKTYLIITDLKENLQDLEIDYNIGSKNIIKLDESSNMPGLTNDGFRPQVVKVDEVGHIYLKIENIGEGIVEIDRNSNFKKFVGTNKVEISAIESFWRKLSNTKSSKKRYIPTEFSSFSVDSSGFVYATNKSLGAKPVQKFNYKGENILVENGNTKVVGDIISGQVISNFIDIDVNNYGLFVALNDATPKTVEGIDVPVNKKMFVYNDSGQLLYILGKYNEISNLSLNDPTKVRWNNNEIVVLDNGKQKTNRIIVFKPTKYGEQINKASELYYKGQLQESKNVWEEILKLNTNNDLAYVGIGKINYQEKNYNQALNNFKLGNNRIYYSKAYAKVRNQNLRKIIPWIIGSVVIAAVGVKGFLIWKKKNQEN